MNIDDILGDFRYDRQFASIIRLIGYVSPLIPSEMHLMSLSRTVKLRGVQPLGIDVAARLGYLEREGLIATVEKVDASEIQSAIEQLVRNGKIKRDEVTFPVYSASQGYVLTERGRYLEQQYNSETS